MMISLILPMGVSRLAAAPPEKAAAQDKRPPAREVTGGILGMMLGTDAAKHVIVVDVAPNSTANDIGVKKNDVLISFDGHEVTTKDELFKFATKSLTAKQPGEAVELVISRNGRSRTFTAVVPERNEPSPAPIIVERDKNIVFCMQLRDTEGARLVVHKVLEESPPHDAGIMPKDVIVSVGKFKIGSIAEFSEAMNAYAQGETVTLGLMRGDQPLIVKMVVAPCHHELNAVAPAVRPREPFTQQSLDRLSAKLRALQAQIEDLRVTAEGIAGMIEAMRER